MSSIFNVLRRRGFIAQTTDTSLGDRLATEKMTVYGGFDPTADSLHLGHLVPIIALAHLQQAGHRVLVLVGGATAMIGDPSGKSEERNLLSAETVDHNVASVKTQLSRFLDFDGDNPAVIVNNADWFGPAELLPFLRDTGKHFRVNEMLAKDSVKRRLDSESGLSFTEFTYQLLQAGDFLHLFDSHNCTLQVGGSDQWGNITAGIELIRKTRQGQAFGLTLPLLTTASGEKFGKTAGHAVWLDEKKTSAWEFFQYLVRQEDADVMRLIKLLTFVPDGKVDELAQSLASEPHKRLAQKALAQALTATVHGEEKAREMARAADVVFGLEIKSLTDETLREVFSSAPSTEIESLALDAGVQLSGLIVSSGLVASKNKARQMIGAGGIYLNNVRVTEDLLVTRSHLASKSFIVLRAGKKNYHLVKVV